MAWNRHIVVDHGPQFTAYAFRDFVNKQRIPMRYGAVGQFHSIGLIDRFFRTLKDSLGLPFYRPWNPREFERWLNFAQLERLVRPRVTLLRLRWPAELYQLDRTVVVQDHRRSDAFGRRPGRREHLLALERRIDVVHLERHVRQPLHDVRHGAA